MKKVQKRAKKGQKHDVRRCRHVAKRVFRVFHFSKTDGKTGLVKNEIVKIVFFDTLPKRCNLTKNQQSIIKDLTPGFRERDHFLNLRKTRKTRFSRFYVFSSFFEIWSRSTVFSGLHSLRRVAINAAKLYPKTMCLYGDSSS